MKKDRNRKNLNTKAFAAAAVLGVGAVAAASFAAYSRTMANLTGFNQRLDFQRA